MTSKKVIWQIKYSDASQIANLGWNSAGNFAFEDRIHKIKNIGGIVNLYHSNDGKFFYLCL